MAQLTITVPDTQLPRIKAALEGIFEDEIDNYANVRLFAEHIVRRYFRDLVRGWEQGQAEMIARNSVDVTNLIPDP